MLDLEEEVRIASVQVGSALRCVWKESALITWSVMSRGPAGAAASVRTTASGVPPRQGLTRVRNAQGVCEQVPRGLRTVQLTLCCEPLFERGRQRRPGRILIDIVTGQRRSSAMFPAPSHR